MMIQRLYILLLLVSGLILTVACSEGGQQSDGDLDAEMEEASDFPIDEIDLTQYVDPLIGSKGAGNVIPGALLPHGMLKLSPDTNAEAGSIDGYEYSHNKIDGFSHTHLEGPGGGSMGYSQILLMPGVGEIKIDKEDYASGYSHETEEASPGYYAVDLSDSSVRVELTAGARAGIHRYTFPASVKSHVLLDLGYSRGDSLGGLVEFVDGSTIRGFGEYDVHPMVSMLLNSDEASVGRSKVYFHAEFSKPTESHGTWKKGAEPEMTADSALEEGSRIGAWVQFETEADEQVEVRIGISFIDAEQAKKNLKKDIGDADFGKIRERARRTWNSLLNRIQVEGGSEADRSIFYTALYHSLIQPSNYTEAGGSFFSAADGLGEVGTATDWQYFTDDWCMWDTFRTSHPLGTLIEPEIRSDIISSMLHWYQQGGWLPKCSWHATGYSRVMIANPAVSIIADAYVKGLDDFDVELAYQAARKSLMEDNENMGSSFMCGYFNLGVPDFYIDQGYVPSECDPSQSVSMTLEYAYNDWCLARMAAGLGKTEDEDYFMKRSQNFRKHWNPEHGFMQGKKEDGSWVEPFDPESMEDFNDFCEASSWIYSWFVPHAVDDMLELMGGSGPFEDRLDDYFETGKHDVTNQPGFHVPYLYNWTGAPHKTQSRIRSLLDDHFDTSEGGLPGNDDSGSMSAWYILNAIGLYPVAPGDAVYQISTPIFDRVVIQLHPEFYQGESFTIETEGLDSGGIYIQSLELNGKTLNKLQITHQEITTGGTLKLKVGKQAP